jgi:hypothetical protein
VFGRRHFDLCLFFIKLGFKAPIFIIASMLVPRQHYPNFLQPNDKLIFILSFAIVKLDVGAEFC